MFATGTRICTHHPGQPTYQGCLQLREAYQSRARPSAYKAKSDQPIKVGVMVHYLAPPGTFDTHDLQNKVQGLIDRLNDILNNPSNARERHTATVQEAISDPDLIEYYTCSEYMDTLPTNPSGIELTLEKILYPTIRNSLDLDGIDEDKVHAEVRQYLWEEAALGSDPSKFLNIWILELSGSKVRALSNLPWQALDSLHGIILDSSVVQKELVAIAAHHLGHYFGLVHLEDDLAEEEPSMEDTNCMVGADWFMMPCLFSSVQITQVHKILRDYRPGLLLPRERPKDRKGTVDASPAKRIARVQTAEDAHSHPVTPKVPNASPIVRQSFDRAAGLYRPKDGKK